MRSPRNADVRGGAAIPCVCVFVCVCVRVHVCARTRVSVRLCARLHASLRTCVIALHLYFLCPESLVNFFYEV